MISNLVIENFKCHKYLDFEFSEKNCIVYGENGSGKSSIYWALYSLFKVYFRNQSFDFYKFKSGVDNLRVKVKVNGRELTIPNSTYTLPSTLPINNACTIYFLNQDSLNVICNENNTFYSALELYFSKYFKIFREIDSRYVQLREEIENGNANYPSIVERKVSIDYDLDTYITKLKDEANLILDHLDDELELNFNLTFHDLDITGGAPEILSPSVKFTINSKSELKLYFNESKLKLVSFAIYFAMINLEDEEYPDNELKLLVLDDFLTSLDMANREYIFSYIHDYFPNYQKIIFTHNLQFFNLMHNWLKFNSKEKWDLQNIYLRQKDGVPESVLYGSNINYLEEAKEKFANNDLPGCGNLIRKEFERIIHELAKIENIGAKEETDSIVQLLANKESGFFKQRSTLEVVLKRVNDCKNMTADMVGNSQKIKDTLNSITYEKLDRSEMLYAVLKRALYFRKILMNKSSHHEPEINIYRSEYDNCLAILDKLNIELDKINS